MNKTDVYFIIITISLAIGALILGGMTKIKHAPELSTVQQTTVEQTTSYKLVVEINTYKKMYR